MIEIKLNFEGDALKKVALLSPKIIKNMDAAVKQAAMLIRNTAIKKMRQPGKGRVYLHYRGGKNPIVHRASAPGDPPATDTARLIGSVRTNYPEIMKSEVGSDVIYAPMVEGGTSRMAARPWLMPSLKENQESIQNLIDRGIEEALK